MTTAEDQAEPFNPYDIVGAYMSDTECFKEMDHDMQVSLMRAIAENLRYEVVDAAALSAKDTELSALRERVGELERALEPFAVAANIRLCGEWRDDEHFCKTDIGHLLTFGHLRAARAVLSPKTGEG